MDGWCVVYPVSDAGHKPARVSSQEFMLELRSFTIRPSKEEKDKRGVGL